MDINCPRCGAAVDLEASCGYGLEVHLQEHGLTWSEAATLGEVTRRQQNPPKLKGGGFSIPVCSEEMAEAHRKGFDLGQSGASLQREFRESWGRSFSGEWVRTGGTK